MSKIDYIFDGAMGTYFNQLQNTYKSSELSNISDAKIIQEIHKQYLKAGATAIKTNTFGLNSNLIEETKRDILINAAIDNALAVVSDEITIFADIGPINTIHNHNEYIDIVKVFEKRGIKNFLFETLLEYESVSTAIKYIKENIQNAIVITSFAVDQDGYTQTGNYYKTLLKVASQYTDYVGLNCIIGPNNMLKLIQNIESDYQLSIMPNAGYVSDYHDEFLLKQNISYFSDVMVKLKTSNVKILGGCCYTTPKHIKALSEKINMYVEPTSKQHHEIFHNYNTKSKIKELFHSNKKIICAELEPPNNIDTTYLENAIKKFEAVKVDAISLVDSPLARTRADSMLLAAKLSSEQITVIPHLTCRDKNQIALKASLLGANLFGVNNVLALSGDGIAKIDRDYTKGVFDFNSYNLINFIKELNNDIFSNNQYYIAAALNINSHNFDIELIRAKIKIEKGVDYFITQSIFTNQAIENVKRAKKELNIPIIVSIYPVASYKNALFLHNEVKGIEIPDKLLNKLEDADKNEYQKISVAFCKKIIDKLYEYVDGFTISTPLRKIDYTIELIKHLKERSDN
ncbi:bifunctional homocysteine S-methyltransferase/methylenetetrahydrofolate reductase [Mycoplasma sp. P36-A1]|uniref:bifunctional homocysteine S-methyltransferase/methylenetetrahydrofolate reductase n=1 Tax=Mycoplasma sp. P36-A1 TaxID=3252900 RepID=UPI003C3026FF